MTGLPHGSILIHEIEDKEEDKIKDEVKSNIKESQYIFDNLDDDNNLFPKSPYSQNKSEEEEELFNVNPTPKDNFEDNQKIIRDIRDMIIRDNNIDLYNLDSQKIIKDNNIDLYNLILKLSEILDIDKYYDFRSKYNPMHDLISACMT